MRISIRIKDQPVRDFFRRFKRARMDPNLWKPALVVYQQFVHEVFEEEGKPDKWAPLKPSTIARRRKGRNRSTGLRIRILRSTGQLLQSATQATGAGFVRMTPNTLTVGSTLRYAKYHHEGTKNMPQRRFFQFDNQVLARMGRAMNIASLHFAKS